MSKFTKVNRAGSRSHVADYQRHHLIPLQAGQIFDVLNERNSSNKFGFDIDSFPENGLLLPGNEIESRKSGLPMHRGPHPKYNDLVIERIMQIMRQSRGMRLSSDRNQFLGFRIRLLQKALRQALVQRKLGALVLNKRDPFGQKDDYRPIDAMVDRIWSVTRNLD